VRTIRKIAQVRRRIRAISLEIAELQKSSLCKLMESNREAKSLGRDMLNEMAVALDEQIEEARTRLAHVVDSDGAR